MSNKQRNRSNQPETLPQEQTTPEVANESLSTQVEQTPEAVETPVVDKVVSISTIPAKPANVFNQIKETASVKQVNRQPSPSDVRERIKAKLGINLEDTNTPQFLRDVCDDLDRYVKVMSPKAMVNEQQVVSEQRALLGVLSTCLGKEPAIGVAGLRILQTYFKMYGDDGAFARHYPFRAFNLLAPELQKLKDVIYALQTITQVGYDQAMKVIDQSAVKQSIASPNGQLVLNAYFSSLDK